MKKIILLASIMLLEFGVFEAAASQRGIGVSPARIELTEVSEWPHTIPLFVTNLSAEMEFFEIVFEADDEGFISVDPGRFPLEAGEQKRIALTFENPGQDTSGLVKISATRLSPAGFLTGTGIEVPFSVTAASSFLVEPGGESKGGASVFSAAIGEFVAFGSWYGRIWGVMAILMSMIFLLFVSVRLSKHTLGKS